MYTMRTDRNESQARDFTCVQMCSLFINAVVNTARHAFVTHTVE